MPYKISITAPERSFNEYISNPRKAFIDHNKKCQPIYMAGILLVVPDSYLLTTVFWLLSNISLLASQVVYSIQESA